MRRREFVTLALAGAVGVAVPAPPVRLESGRVIVLASDGSHCQLHAPEGAAAYLNESGDLVIDCRERT